MDDEVERLERALRKDPSDAEAAARLKAALLRAGRRDELALRYRLGVVCDVRWEAMTPTPVPEVRRCDRCRRDVHAADSYGDFDRLAAAGHCVAVLPHELPRVLDGLIDAPGGGPVRGPTEPCLVERPLEAPFVMPRRLAGAPLPMHRLPRRDPTPPPPGPAPDVASRPGLLQRLKDLFGR